MNVNSLGLSLGGTHQRKPYDPSWFEVVEYGAVGDGVADDTAALQAAFHAAAGANGTVFFPPGIYRVIDHLYFWGRCDIVGCVGAEVRLDADPTHGSYWLNGGIKGYGATGGNGLLATWTGVIENIKFSTTANVVAPLRLVNVHRGLNWQIRGCAFDVTGSGTAAIGPIGCYNNAAFCNPPTRVNGHIIGNTVNALQDANGSEGIGVGDATGLMISGNYVYGVGDDGIMAHSVDNVIMSGNQVYTVDGRIGASSSTRVVIANNYVERIPYGAVTYNGGGLLEIDLEYTTAPAPSDTLISNNVLVHADGLTGATYGMRIRGARRCSVVGNTIFDRSGFGRAIEVQPRQLAGWGDPEGLDPDDIARVRDVLVFGNHATGGGANLIMEENLGGIAGTPATLIPGPCLWMGNYAPVQNVYSTSASRVLATPNTGHFGFGTTTPGVSGLLGTLVTVAGTSQPALEVWVRNDSLAADAYGGGLSLLVNASSPTEIARINARTVGAGTNAGDLAFLTKGVGVALSEKLRLFGSGSLGLNMTALGANAAGVFGMGSGTAPTTSPANAAQMWVADVVGVAGKAGFHMRGEETGSQVIVGAVIKTDAGDPAYNHEGLICINTADNTVKIYGDGAWRTIASGW